MRGKDLRPFLIVLFAVIIILGIVGGYVLFALAIPVGRSFLGIAIVLLIFVGFPLSLMHVYGVQSSRTEEVDQKRFEAFIKEYLGEKVLGSIRVRRMTGSPLRATEIHEVLVVTQNNVFIVETAEVTPVSGVYGGGAHIDLKANEKAIPNSKIQKVELTQFLGFRIRLSLITSEKEYKWWIQGMIPDKKSKKLEDYKTILRPVFGDRLSVKG